MSQKVSREELIQLINESEDEFIIHVELVEEEKHDAKKEFKLTMVSVRLVKDAPVYMKHRIISPVSAVGFYKKIMKLTVKP